MTHNIRLILPILLITLAGFTTLSQEVVTSITTVATGNYRPEIAQIGHRVERLADKERQDTAVSSQERLQRELERLAKLREEYFKLQRQQDAMRSQTRQTESQLAAWQQSLAREQAQPEQPPVQKVSPNYVALADLYWRERRYAEAALAYERGANGPTAPDFLRYKLAQAYMKMGDLAKATAMFQRLASGTSLPARQATWQLEYLQWQQQIASMLPLEQLSSEKSLSTVENLPSEQSQSNMTAPAHLPLTTVPPEQSQPKKRLPEKSPPQPLPKTLLPKKSLPSGLQAMVAWYPSLNDCLQKIKALQLGDIAGQDSQASIHLARIDNYLVTMQNYPKELTRLASELQSAMVGSDLQTWLSQELAISQTISKSESLRCLEVFVRDGRFEIQATDELVALQQKVAQLQNEVKNSTAKPGLIKELRSCLQIIHDKYEAGSQRLTSAITNFQVSR